LVYMTSQGICGHTCADTAAHCCLYALGTLEEKTALKPTAASGVHMDALGMALGHASLALTQHTHA